MLKGQYWMELVCEAKSASRCLEPCSSVGQTSLEWLDVAETGEEPIGLKRVGDGDAAKVVAGLNFDVGDVVGGYVSC